MKPIQVIALIGCAFASGSSLGALVYNLTSPGLSYQGVLFYATGFVAFFMGFFVVLIDTAIRRLTA